MIQRDIFEAASYMIKHFIIIMTSLLDEIGRVQIFQLYSCIINDFSSKQTKRWTGGI